MLLTGSLGSNNLADQVVDSALRYRAQAPVIDSLLKDIGLSSADTKGISDLLNNQLGHTNNSDSTDQQSSDNDSD